MANYELPFRGGAVSSLLSQESDTADYITERGETEGWQYEKWNSGWMVLRKHFTVNVTGWENWGDVYEARPYLDQQDYPFAFVSEPFLNCIGLFKDQYCSGLSYSQNYSPLTKTPFITVLRPTASINTTETACYSITASGFYK